MSTWSDLEKRTLTSLCLEVCRLPLVYAWVHTHTHTHTHTHRNTLKQYSHKQRGEPESRRQSSPRGAPSSYLHPPSSSSLLGWGGYTGVTCLLLKVSKHPGESLFTPLKKVGIPISRRPSFPSATQRRREKPRGCDGDKSEHFVGQPSCWCLCLLQSILLCSYLLSSLLLLLLFFSSRSLWPYLHAKPARFDTLHLACQQRWHMYPFIRPCRLC